MLNFCLVSRQFSDLATPLLLSRISLGGFTSRLKHRSTQLKALSKGGTKASDLAKHLSIDYSTSFSNDPAKVLTPLEVTMLKHLKSAIGSFKAVTTISWKIGQHEPTQIKDFIVSSLAAIPTLRAINLSCLTYSSSNIGNLSAFANLHKIRIRFAHIPREVVLALGKVLAQSPALTDLDVFIDADMSQVFQFVDQAGMLLSLQHFSMTQVKIFPDYFKSAIQHLRSLQSLYLYRYYVGVGSGPTIWDILITEKIHIRNLSTDVVDDSLLRYLSSFQGLRRFSSITSSSSPKDVPVDIVRAMVPHHAESLAELDILANTDHQIGDWSPPFSENLVSLLSSFNNLRYFALQLQYTADYIPIIKYAIPTCAKVFPKLERLVLHTPYLAFYLRNADIASPLAFSHGFSRHIHNAITENQFDEPTVPSFKMYCEYLVYKPLKDEIAGTFSYIQVT